jgi:hypothetical protein
LFLHPEKYFCHFGKSIIMPIFSKMAKYFAKMEKNPLEKDSMFFILEFAILEKYFLRWKNIFQNEIIFFQNGRIFSNLEQYFYKMEEYFPI